MWRFALNIYHAPAHVVSVAFPRIRVSGPNNQPWLYLDENAFLALLNELLERFYEHSGSYKLPTLAPIISENLKTITATGSTSFSADSNIFAVCCETDIHLLSFPTAAHTVHHCRLNAHTNHMLNEDDVLEIFSMCWRIWLVVFCLHLCVLLHLSVCCVVLATPRCTLLQLCSGVRD